MTLSKPSRPARMAPVVSMYSWCSPSRTVVLSMKSMVCPGPATKPSRDIRKWKSTFPAVVCGSGSPMIASSLSGSESNVSR
jgi:hypothetical protein